MTAWPGPEHPAPHALAGSDGELVSIHVAIEPRLLERLLDTLARLDFPINPEIRHAAGPRTVVEFPAWSARVDAVRAAIAAARLDSAVVTERSMLDEITSNPPDSLPVVA